MATWSLGGPQPTPWGFKADGFAVGGLSCWFGMEPPKFPKVSEFLLVLVCFFCFLVFIFVTEGSV